MNSKKPVVFLLLLKLIFEMKKIIRLVGKEVAALARCARSRRELDKGRTAKADLERQLDEVIAEGEKVLLLFAFMFGNWQI